MEGSGKPTPSRWIHSMKYRIKKYLDDLEKWEPRKWKGVVEIKPSDVNARQLFMVFEEGALSERHLKVLNDLMAANPGKIVIDFF